MASRIVTIQRAKLDSKVIADLKDNSIFLNKNFYDITGKEDRILPNAYPTEDKDKDMDDDDEG